MKTKLKMIKNLLILLFSGYILLESSYINQDRKQSKDKTFKSRKGQQEHETISQLAFRTIILVLIIVIIIKYWAVGIQLLLKLLFNIWEFTDQLRWGIWVASGVVVLKHLAIAAAATALAGVTLIGGPILTPFLLNLAASEMLEAAIWSGITAGVGVFNMYADREWGSPTKGEEACVLKCYQWCANNATGSVREEKFKYTYTEDGIETTKECDSKCNCGLESLKGIMGGEVKGPDFASLFKLGELTYDAINQVISGFAIVLPKNPLS